MIISSNRYNELRSDVIIMAIMSNTYMADGKTEHVIDDWEGAGLLKPSLIKTAVSTIERKLIIKKLGRFVSKDIALLDKALMALFELKP